jgi:hypothetical protein
MKVEVQLHAPVAVPAEGEPTAPAGWATSRTQKLIWLWRHREVTVAVPVGN